MIVRLCYWIVGAVLIAMALWLVLGLRPEYVQIGGPR